MENRHLEKTNWRQVLIFLGITFGLTYLLDLLLYQTVGYSQTLGTGLLLQVQMLIPATVAIALQLFWFKDSPLYRLRERPRWFFYFYLFYTILYALLAVSVVFISSPIFQTAVSVILQLLTFIGLLFLVLLRLASGKEAFSRSGLRGGKAWYYVTFGLFVLALYSVMTGLNALFGLGQAVNVKEFLRQAAGGQASGLEAMPDWAILLLTSLQSVLLAPFLALLITFGEEYGWRVYLQGELVKMGKVRGILLVGIIWGLWHTPIILMGHNYPGYPVLGSFLMVLYCIALAFLLGFAVLKSGSVWLAAYLHGLNNQVASFLMLMVHTPADPVFSFGVGIYGLAIWALVVVGLLVLGHKEWASSSLARQEVSPGASPGL
ncbi:MAG: CPBP family intramembrane glutamic endopeptidase [Anaerolineae bacterium]